MFPRKERKRKIRLMKKSHRSSSCLPLSHPRLLPSSLAYSFATTNTHHRSSSHASPLFSAITAKSQCIDRGFRTLAATSPTVTTSHLRAPTHTRKCKLPQILPEEQHQTKTMQWKRKFMAYKAAAQCPIPLVFHNEVIDLASLPDKTPFSLSGIF